MPLTPKQEQFVSEYIIDYNGTQAAIRAGYSPKTAKSVACENLTKPDIQSALTDAIQQRQQRTEISQDWVIERLVENTNRAMTAKPVLNKQGKPTGEYTYHGGVANRALELIGKHQGMFQEKQDIHHQGEITIKVVYEDG